MTAIDRTTFDITSKFPPEFERSTMVLIPFLYPPMFTPYSKYGASNLLSGGNIGNIVLTVYCCSCSVFFANCMNSRGIA
ncbi:hypothetical protein PSAC2689_110063 [Paraburkholderia sacchari]